MPEKHQTSQKCTYFFRIFQSRMFQATDNLLNYCRYANNKLMIINFKQWSLRE